MNNARFYIAPKPNTYQIDIGPIENGDVYSITGMSLYFSGASDVVAECEMTSSYSTVVGREEIIAFKVDHELVRGTVMFLVKAVGQVVIDANGLHQTEVATNRGLKLAGIRPTARITHLGRPVPLPFGDHDGTPMASPKVGDGWFNPKTGVGKKKYWQQGRNGKPQRY